MPEPLTKISISAAYQSLPEQVRDWLSSDSVTFAIAETNTRLGLKEWRRRIIPTLVLRLIVQDIEPTDFINDLSRELNVSFQTAKAIAEDIETKVLKPIENELRREVGVDIKLIYFGKPGSRNSVAPQSDLSASQKGLAEFSLPGKPEIETATPTPTFRAPPVQKSFRDFIKTPVSGSTTPESPKAAPSEIPFTPFMLHEETASASQAVGRQETYQSKSDLTSRISSWSFEKKPAAKPGVSVRLETPDANSGMRKADYEPVPRSPKATGIPAESLGTHANIKEQKLLGANHEQNIRVVHYNGPRTPLNNAGLPKKQPENTVDLRKFSK